MSGTVFFDRDLSWLSFNQRVLDEAAKDWVPLMERIRFLSIYSSNLDEFYRVRIPAIKALAKIKKFKKESTVYAQAGDTIQLQQIQYGEILTLSIIPALQQQGIHLVYNENFPAEIVPAIQNYFFTQVAGFLQIRRLSEATVFFPENNQLYLLVIVQQDGGEEQLFLINVPSGHVNRFLKIQAGKVYVVFLEDIIWHHLHCLFPNATVTASYNIKITRDAELDLQDEYGDDIAEKIERQLSKRDFGLATRFLYEPGLPLRHLQSFIQIFNLQNAAVVEGGVYHHLKDLDRLPVLGLIPEYTPWPALPIGNSLSCTASLFDQVTKQDKMIHVPYQSYDTVLRFFNEAAIDDTVEEIYTTLYRVASDSKIVHALMSAATNGKKVVVLVELKARFDEANNIKWAKRMKAAGVRILYSDNAIKVHAKIALIKRKDVGVPLLGLLATGNLNENTARIYTDHILLTANQQMLQEMLILFNFLSIRKKTERDNVFFQHLLVAQFNLQSKFIELIDREIVHAKQALPAGITIKLNNLDEEMLINKLYEASNAGVKINLLVRGICILVPGVPMQSENIIVKRIVDRYLEHGRVFIFQNDGDPQIFMGSSDWMNRNIYRRIEVCFPIYDAVIREQLQQIIAFQWSDNKQAVLIDKELNNIKIIDHLEPVRSQEAVYRFLSGLESGNELAIEKWEIGNSNSIKKAVANCEN